MKYNEYPCVMSYNPPHGYLASQYTSDPEQLRALAIAMVQKVMAENAELQNRIRIQEEQMKLARQQRFGKKCESLAGMQRSLFEEDVDADIAEISAHLDKLLPQTGDEEKTTTRPVRKPLPSPLPRAEKVIPPAEERCPDCDAPLHFIRDEVSEKLEYIPAQVVVNRYIRPQYSCPCCEKVFSGKMPAHILPKSAVEPSVIAQVVISKYTDHLPCIASSTFSPEWGWSSPSVQWRIWSVLLALHWPRWQNCYATSF